MTCSVRMRQRVNAFATQSTQAETLIQVVAKQEKTCRAMKIAAREPITE